MQSSMHVHIPPPSPPAARQVPEAGWDSQPAASQGVGLSPPASPLKSGLLQSSVSGEGAAQGLSSCWPGMGYSHSSRLLCCGVCCLQMPQRPCTASVDEPLLALAYVCQQRPLSKERTPLFDMLRMVLNSAPPQARHEESAQARSPSYNHQQHASPADCNPEPASA